MIRNAIHFSEIKCHSALWYVVWCDIVVLSCVVRCGVVLCGVVVWCGVVWCLIYSRR